MLVFINVICISRRANWLPDVSVFVDLLDATGNSSNNRNIGPAVPVGDVLGIEFPVLHSCAR